jgi:DNA-directed RNA polymerase specialized sigma24 family protein
MENINLIRKIAWSFHKTSQLDYDDLFQEAYLAYVYGLKTYDPTKGYLSTHLWNHITNQLKTYAKKERERTATLVPLDAVQHYISIGHDPFFESLTFDAQYISQVVLATGKILRMLPEKSEGRCPRPILRRLEHVLLRNGWSYQRINYAFRELRTACGYKE